MDIASHPRGADSARAVDSDHPLQDRGHREGRAPADAHGPPAKRMQAAGTTGAAEITRPSLRNGFNGCFAISLVRRACWPPLRMMLTHQRGHQHRGVRTTRLDRACIAVRPREKAHAASTHAHRIPLPASRDGRDTPLMRQQDEREHRPDLPDAASPATCDISTRRAVRA